MAKVKTRMKHPVLFVICILLSLISLYIASVGGQITRELTRNPVNLNELSPETAVDGLNVEGLVYAANGSYGQTYSLDDDGSVIEGAPMNYYFLIPVNDNYCISLFTNETEIVNQLYSLTAATEKFSKGETETIECPNFYFVGRLSALTQDETEHLYSWALEGKMFGAEDAAGVSKYIIPFKIYKTDTTVGLPELLGGSAAFLLFSILVLVLVKQRVSVDDDDDDLI